jgi:phosphomannomutase
MKTTHIELAKRWIDIDNSPLHQQQLQHWIQTENWTAIEECLSKRLQFGTAGLRGTVGPGTNRMNRGMVQQTALGIAHYVEQQSLPKSAVIGFDARNDSLQFAQDVADVLHHEGFQVDLFDRPAPTPIVAYAVQWLKATVGVVITASHNPAPDNGFKVYWSNGAQIIPPVDTGIATAIEHISKIAVWQTHITGIQHPTPPQELIEDYFASIKTLRITPTTGAHLVYTPMHGVGGWAVERTLQEAGHTWTPVPKQAEPDGTFPTTQFPNPEEEGALDCAIQVADTVGADAILANDPDADRLAVALRNDSGEWTRLTGDQVGLLFAYYYGETCTLHPNTLFANTIVSSSQLKSIAHSLGVQFTQTLTGFKWLANAGMHHKEQTGHPLLLGYEEALGYSLGGIVQDKDGVSAVLIMADIISHYKQQHKTLWNVLAEMALIHGLALSSQHSIKKSGLDGAEEIKAMMADIRSNPPMKIANSTVHTIEDYETLTRWTTESTDSILDMPSSNVLVFWLENNERVIVRPSGTEPKIKFYFEAIRPIKHIQELSTVQKGIEHRLMELWHSMNSMLN